MSQYKSFAEWPAETFAGADGTHISSDTHATKEEALAVCGLLHLNGFGGDRRSFPLRAWVEEIPAAIHPVPMETIDALSSVSERAHATTVPDDCCVMLKSAVTAIDNEFARLRGELAQVTRERDEARLIAEERIKLMAVINGDDPKAIAELIAERDALRADKERFCDASETCPKCRGAGGFDDTTYNRTGEWCNCDRCEGRGNVVNAGRFFAAIDSARKEQA